MNLHAISYLNIGPFKDESISIFFNKGKYLIKAAIGSGKSFLFFDGPMYGLYKYSARKMVNMQSDMWYIKLWFDIDGQHYFVVRKLKKWKSKDSCSSKFYNINKVPAINNNSGIVKWVDIETMFSWNLEEIVFKNETDLQQTVSTLLPLREVFSSTIFLMQDADNIFELLPSERLNVLKNVFGLLWIDEAKDKIAEKRRSIQTEIKIKSNTGNYDSKLKVYLQDWLKNYNALKKSEIFNATNDLPIHWKAQDVEEVKNLAEKINIQNFSSSVLPKDLHTELSQIIEEKKAWFLGIKAKLDAVQKILNELIHKAQNLEKEQRIKQSEMILLDEKIAKINPEKLKDLKLAKQQVFEKQEEILKQIPSWKLNRFLSKNETTELFKGREWNNNFWISTSIANSFVDYCISTGKLLKEELNTLQAQKKQIASELAHSEEKKSHYKQAIEKLQQSIKEFNEYIAEQKKYYCKKIDSHCPFIKQINKKSFEQMEQQKFKLTEELKQLTWEFEERKNKQKSNTDQEVMAWVGQWSLWQNKSIDQKFKKLESLLDILKIFLDDVDWKNIKELNTSYQALEEEKRKLESNILALEKESNSLDEYKLQKEKLKSDLEYIIKQAEEFWKDKASQEKEKLRIETELKAQNYDILLSVEQKHKALEQSFSHLNNLIDDYKNTQIELLKIKEEEKIMNNLYQIFSRELLLLVLEDSLPTLSEIINTFLGQVVDYQISFFLSKSATDKLELEAKIYDEKWERDVKSLSWGQRIILKLVRMLAISSYMNSPMLFLDETINNLDQDTVGKVADMLEDFVKKRDIKLYTVTHSQQIQDMDIWDKVLEIG